MKLTWNRKTNNKKRSLDAIANYPNLPFDQHKPSADDTQLQNGEPAASQNQEKPSADALDSDSQQLAQSFQAQGNKLAEDGKYREALGKWEAALNLMPENAVLLEQKAQVLLEIGDAWSALKAATRATELEPSWPEAWITLGRAQLNFGEPDSAIESFDRALAIKPDSVEAQDDRKTALHLIKRRKQLHSSGLSTDTNRYMVGDRTEAS
ncbi:tetratricopeptide repeat protein 33 isoform X2 [Durio zibethinus]|uniref:Tetratricopeptide repeat protein 33 isoform X2 n=1 Tax=Durio zibethinus TaxID=66656 RepID=A0A6P6ATG7_DURZI|nr:tetratricopeptide repeat protein 33 isoform X2 [Durio zibethinus]